MTTTQIEIISHIASVLLFYKIVVITSKWGRGGWLKKLFIGCKPRSDKFCWIYYGCKSNF